MYVRVPFFIHRRIVQVDTLRYSALASRSIIRVTLRLAWDCLLDSTPDMVRILLCVVKGHPARHFTIRFWHSSLGRRLPKLRNFSSLPIISFAETILFSTS